MIVWFFKKTSKGGPKEGKGGLGQKVLRPCMGDECLRYSFNAVPKVLPKEGKGGFRAKGTEALYGW